MPVLLSLLLVSYFFAEAASQELDTSVIYPAKVLNGTSEEVCTPSELEMILNQIGQEVSNILQNTDTQCPGQTSEHPASSCREVSQCDPGLPSEYYSITNANGAVVQVYCDMSNRQFVGITGGWIRAGFLNMSNLTNTCPLRWRTIESTYRTCGRNAPSAGGYETVTYQTHGISYTHVCGRINAYQYGSPEAFRPYIDNPYSAGGRTIDDIYVDGVSLTYGTNPRKHIWTFSAAISRTFIHQYVVCPCTRPPNTASITVPPFIGSDYFCDAGTDQWIDNSVFYPEDDPLWDGQGCPSTSTCCQFNSPPWFCRTLPEPTTEDIELRLMADQGYNNEDVPLQLIEIFIQ